MLRPKTEADLEKLGVELGPNDKTKARAIAKVKLPTVGSVAEAMQRIKDRESKIKNTTDWISEREHQLTVDHRHQGLDLLIVKAETIKIHGQWKQAKIELGISDQRADDYTKYPEIFKTDAEAYKHTVREARELIRKTERPRPKKSSLPAPVAAKPESSPPAPVAAPVAAPVEPEPARVDEKPVAPVAAATPEETEPDEKPHPYENSPFNSREYTNEFNKIIKQIEMELADHEDPMGNAHRWLVRIQAAKEKAKQDAIKTKNDWKLKMAAQRKAKEKAAAKAKKKPTPKKKPAAKKAPADRNRFCHGCLKPFNLDDGGRDLDGTTGICPKCSKPPAKKASKTKPAFMVPIEIARPDLVPIDRRRRTCTSCHESFTLDDGGKEDPTRAGMGICPDCMSY